MSPVWSYIYSGRQFEENFIAHIGEKSNKCNICKYASSQSSDLRRLMKTHNGEKSKKCNQFHFASYQAVLWRYISKPKEKRSETNATNFTSHLLGQTLIETNLKKKTAEKNQTNATNMTVSFSEAGSLRRHLKTQWRKVIKI